MSLDDTDLDALADRVADRIAARIASLLETAETDAGRKPLPASEVDARHRLRHGHTSAAILAGALPATSRPGRGGRLWRFVEPADVRAWAARGFPLKPTT